MTTIQHAQPLERYIAQNSPVLLQTLAKVQAFDDIFPLGRVVIAQAAARELDARDVLYGLHRHQSADWADYSESDQNENFLALQEGGRLTSFFWKKTGTSFWIVTAADRQTTTVYLLEDL